MQHAPRSHYESLRESKYPKFLFPQKQVDTTLAQNISPTLTKQVGPKVLKQNVATPALTLLQPLAQRLLFLKIGNHHQAKHKLCSQLPQLLSRKFDYEKSALQ